LHGFLLWFALVLFFVASKQKPVSEVRDVLKASATAFPSAKGSRLLHDKTRGESDNAPSGKEHGKNGCEKYPNCFEFHIEP